MPSTHRVTSLLSLVETGPGRLFWDGPGTALEVLIYVLCYSTVLWQTELMVCPRDAMHCRREPLPERLRQARQKEKLLFYNNIELMGSFSSNKYKPRP